MGSFFGHLLPGSIFAITGLWWLFNNYRRYFRKDIPYISALTFAVPRTCTRVHPDALVWLLVSVTGCVAEWVIVPAYRSVVHAGLHFHMGMNNLQHGTMYFFFGIAATITIITSRYAPTQDHLQYISLAMALAIEAILFQFHLYERNGVDVVVHTLLVYVVWGNVITVLLEMRYRRNLLLSVFKSGMLILQGTWFIQVGFFLYNPFRGFWWRGPYDNHDQSADLSLAEKLEQRDTMMFMACTFAWHAAAVFIFVLVTGAAMSARMRKTTTLSMSAVNFKLLPQNHLDDTPNDEEYD